MNIALGHDIHHAIQSANARFGEAFRTGSAAQLAALYTPQGQILPTGSEPLSGTAAIQAFWQGVLDMGMVDAVLETVELEHLGNTAMEVGQYSLYTQNGNVADWGKYLVIWKEHHGTWKMHRDIWNTNLPPIPHQQA